MKQVFVLFLAMVTFATFSQGQMIDRYGINIGTSYTSQVWDFKCVSIDSEKEFKFGIQSFLQAEKDFGNIVAFRSELGYIQKGFKEKLELLFIDGNSPITVNDNVVLHDLALCLGLKAKPLKAGFSPYLLLGLRGDYMISYKVIVFEEETLGVESKIYETLINDFNNFNLGGLIGLGIDFKGLVYVEAEYNPNFTKNLNDSGLSIYDICWGTKLGLNINRLAKE